MTGNRVWQAALTAGSLLCASGLPTLGEQVHEDIGGLCFETTPDGATMLEHHIGGCFNTRCTDVPENILAAVVTEEPPVVRVTSRVVTAPSGAIVCNTDCNFMPGTSVDLGVVPAVTYQVYLGDRLLGSWVPVPGAEPACLSAG